MIYKNIEIKKIGLFYGFRIESGTSIIQRIYRTLELAKDSIDRKIYLWH